MTVVTVCSNFNSSSLDKSFCTLQMLTVDVPSDDFQTASAISPKHPCCEFSTILFLENYYSEPMILQ